MAEAEAEEFRGTRFYLWGDGESECSFCPFPGAAVIHDIRIPIGWGLVPDPGCGVALLSSQAPPCRVSASEALQFAANGKAGFRLLAEHELDG